MQYCDTAAAAGYPVPPHDAIAGEHQKRVQDLRVKPSLRQAGMSMLLLLRDVDIMYLVWEGSNTDMSYS